MQNFILFLKRFYLLLLFLILEIASIALIVNQNKFYNSKWVNSSQLIVGKYYNKTNAIKDYFGLKKQNEKLTEDIVHLLNSQKVVYTAADDSLIEGKKDTVVETIPLSKYEYLNATVINNSRRRNYNYLTLNAGTKDGVDVGMGVVDVHGIIGIVVNVSSNFSTAISILNIKTSISVRHENSGMIGILKWQGKNPYKMVMEDVNKTASVNVGDTVVTSGYSTIFPPEYPVAVVLSKEKIEGGSFQRLHVNLFNDVGSADKVYIVKHKQRIEIEELEQKFVD